MAGALRPTSHWEDWVSWGLGFWLLISPWILAFSDESVALRNAIAVGFVLIFAEVVTLSVFRPWEVWISVLIGAWLIASPFVLGLSSVAAVANAVIIGTIVVLLAFYEMWKIKRDSGVA